MDPSTVALLEVAAMVVGAITGVTVAMALYVEKIRTLIRDTAHLCGLVLVYGITMVFALWIVISEYLDTDD